MSINNIATLKNAINRIRGEHESRAWCKVTITASVNRKKIITNQEFEINISIDTKFGEVSIMWEDGGFNNYKDFGLPGAIYSEKNKFIDTGNNTFEIIDHEEQYKIHVNYNNAHHIKHLR